MQHNQLCVEMKNDEDFSFIFKGKCFKLLSREILDSLELFTFLNEINSGKMSGTEIHKTWDIFILRIEINATFSLITNLGQRNVNAKIKLC